MFAFNNAQDCDENMLMYDCVGLGFCNNEADWGYDCFVYNEFCIYFLTILDNFTNIFNKFLRI